MNCYNCGAELGLGDLCPNCGADVKYYKKIIASANVLYNQGLAKARERDLTGAAESLRRCLRLDKTNINARNLLGLVYYELGDYPYAIAEWSISRTLMPQDNPATPYLYDLIGGDKRDAVNELIEKYNQAVVYQQQGSVDLAILQLKKVVDEQPKFVRARQLLALLYARQGQYNEARTQLKAAAAIDRKNPRTLWYLKEISKVRKAMGMTTHHTKKSGSVSYQNGNDTVIQPVEQRFVRPRSAVMNFVLGMIIGALIVYFLVVPSIRASINSNANQSVTSANEQLAQQNATVDSLKAEIESLNAKVNSYESADAQESTLTEDYVQMLTAYQKIQEEDLDAAKEAIDKVDDSVLDDDMKTVYNELKVLAYAGELETDYQTAVTAYQQQDFASAIESFESIVELDETYQDGAALYYLAAAYYQNGDTDKAVTTYKRVINLFPDTQYAVESQSMVDAIEADSSSGTTDTANAGAAADTTENGTTASDATTNTTGTYNTTGATGGTQ